MTSDGVAAIVGGDCSGVTGAVLQNVARPNGIVMVSPSATSPALSTAEDDGLFFRTAPSDARQGVVMTDILEERGITSVALTYTNNDYGKGLAIALPRNSPRAAARSPSRPRMKTARPTIRPKWARWPRRWRNPRCGGLYRSGRLGHHPRRAGFGRLQHLHAAGRHGGAALEERFGAEINGSFGQLPGTDSDGATIYQGLATAAGFDGTSAFSPESYDARP